MLSLVNAPLPVSGSAVIKALMDGITSILRMGKSVERIGESALSRADTQSRLQ